MKTAPLYGGWRHGPTVTVDNMIGRDTPKIVTTVKEATAKYSVIADSRFTRWINGRDGLVRYRRRRVHLTKLLGLLKRRTRDHGYS